MSEELVRREDRRPLTAAEIKAQVQVIQQVMAAVMVKDTHYGTIPGTKKPTLYKAGAEKILATFHIASYPKEVEDLSSADEIRYRVKVHGITSGDFGETLVGVGIGECSSNEEKYKWRKPVCDEEFNETAEDRRREVWKKEDGKPIKIKQVRVNPSDIANTVLKMAKKRSQIDMTLTATAASDVFDQDLEDLPEGMEMHPNGKPPITEPKKKEPPKEEKKSTNPTLKTSILNVKTKTGKSDKGEWTLFWIYGIKDANETSFSTFSKTHGELALAEKGTGVMFEFEYQEKEKDSKKYLELINLTKLEREPGSDDK